MTTPIPAAATVADLLPETPAPMPAHTYKLTQVVLDGYQEQGAHGCLHGQPVRRHIKRTHQITVARGLTWQDAKTRRNADRKAGLQIVAERA